MNVLTQIIPNLFIGDNIIANNTGLLLQNNITALVNCTELDNPTNFIGEMYKMNIIDVEEYNSQFYNQLDNVIKFIHVNLSQNKKVMIYCEWGVSRSSSILCAYLMYIKHFNGNLIANCKYIMDMRQFAFHSGTKFRFAESLNRYQKSLGYTGEELLEEYPKNHFVKFYWS